MKESIKGLVVTGINNIYTVRADDRDWLCRIKGKILKAEQRFYNPIAAGDYVYFLPDTHTRDRGWIESVLERKSFIMRWNKKRRAPQILAANIDLLFIVVSVVSPPFKSRFIDRLLICATVGSARPVIVINKIDLGLKDEVQKRAKSYRELGIPVLFTSAVRGEGMEQVTGMMKGKVSVFIGQSGVGKTSILNAIDPELDLPTGKVSPKYNRGSHTTNFARLYQIDEKTQIIDTPGIRELDIYGVEPMDLHLYFPDFNVYRESCRYPSCRHLAEPGCAVKEAVARGEIDRERYESYLRIYNQLKHEKRYYHG